MGCKLKCQLSNDWVSNEMKIKVDCDINRIYDKILDHDWFSARLFVT